VFILIYYGVAVLVYGSSFLPPTQIIEKIKDTSFGILFKIKKREDNKDDGPLLPSLYCSNEVVATVIAALKPPLLPCHSCGTDFLEL